MDFSYPAPTQYPTKDDAYFLEFINKIYGSHAAAVAVNHVSFASPADEGCPIASLVTHFTWDTNGTPAMVVAHYHIDLSGEACQALKNNGFEQLLIEAVQETHSIGEDLSLSSVSEEDLLILHARAIQACKNVSLVTVPYQWYKHSSKELKDELEECFPGLEAGFRESSDDNTCVRIGRDPSRIPRCQKCREEKKGCDRKRPCGRCEAVGLAFHECVPEDAGNSRKGFYGGHYTKGSKLTRAQALARDQDAAATPAE